MKIIASGLFLIVNIFIATSQDSKDLNKISQELLQAVIDKNDTQSYQDILAHTSIEEFEKGLTTDHQKLAFWVNIYNAYIQIILRKNPALYENRGQFFKLKQIPIVQDTLSFAEIEHGIIRHSQLEYFIGYITNPFASEFEKRLRVEERDYRIHFALNCGAKDCPPVAIYSAEDLDWEFDYTTKMYLNGYSKVNKEKKEVHTAQLFAWFRGDFGGSDGIRDILIKYGVIPKSPKYKMLQRKYDWTLSLNNFVSFPEKS